MKRYPIAAFIFFFFAFFAVLGMAGVTELRFQHLTPADGLSQNSVTAILQDSRGFMWFGTQDGLNRYDGHRFTIFKADKNDPGGLSGSIITVLFEDRQGVIWIGTQGGGVNCFNRNTAQFRHYFHNPEDSGSISNNTIRAIVEDGRGVLWIATADGLNALHPGESFFSKYKVAANPKKGIGNNYVSSLAIDKNGDLWVGTYLGLDRFDRMQNEFTHFYYSAVSATDASANFVTAILPDIDGFLWLGSNGGVDRFDPRTGVFKRYLVNYDTPPNSSQYFVKNLYKNDAGILHIATARGIVQYDVGKGTIAKLQQSSVNISGLNSDDIFSFCRDRAGSLWVGTARGLNVLHQNPSYFEHFRNVQDDANSLSDDRVRSFYEDRDGIVWIGTENGLNAFDRETRRFTRYFFPPQTENFQGDSAIRGICALKDGNLWLATFNGLKRFDPRTGRVQSLRATPGDPRRGPLNNNVRRVFYDVWGNLWIGTVFGLSLFHENTKTFEHFRDNPLDPDSLSDNFINFIFQDSRKTIWIGTQGGGLNQLLSGKEARGRPAAFRVFKKRLGLAKSISSDTVLSILEDRQGMLWLGTGSGLDRFDPASRTFSNFSERNGLPNNWIYGITQDSAGMLWLSSNRGLCRFDPRNATFKSYGPAHGIQDLEFNNGAFLKSRDGTMFFGGINGFNMFDPAKIKDNTVIPPVVITGVKVYPRNYSLPGDIMPGQQLDLSYRDTLITIEFAALSFNDPAANQYAYRIDGLNKDWIDLGHTHSLTLTNLKPGKYVFRVKGSNNDGIWNDTGTSLRIVVFPPFWRTWWFAALLAAIFLAGGWVVYKTRRKRLAGKLKTAAELSKYGDQFGLSAREQEIILFVLAGKSNKEIESKLFLADSTVRNHIYSIYRKLDIKNRAQLVAFFKNLNKG
jgi:ligand-binding sensor domain-containing protein/DNA-binding CsgD family transcriptional regulator